MADRYILHADMDAFYASVERLDDPRLEGKPLVVGGSPEHRGVVAAASYEARRYGIHSAMPMRTAMRLCPDLVRVSPRFDRYHEVSSRVMAIFGEVTPLVEPLSLDEAYLDVTDQASAPNVNVLAFNLKARVMEEVGLVVTIGGGISKTVAKVASKRAKPNGLLLVRPGDEEAFLAPLDIDILLGIGPRSAEVLR
jgi:DNA polymerase-4